jgi:cytochrome c biogenesis protein CcdA
VTGSVPGVGISPEEAVLGEGTGAAPTIFIATLAGFLSFASPCVLPLIPAYIGFIGGWAVNNAGK